MDRFSFAKRHVKFFSDETSSKVASIKPQLIKQIRASSMLFKLIGVLLFALYPIFVTVIQSDPDLSISENFQQLFGRIWIWVGVALFTLLAIIHSLSMMDAPSVTIIVSEIEEEMKRIEAEADLQYEALVFSTAVNGLARMILTFQKAVSGQGPISEYERFRLNCEMLFSFLVTQDDGEVVYKFNPGENWNLGVYLFNNESEELECCFRDAAPSFLGRKFGDERPWSPGEGHIGVAYALEAPQVTGDITKAENRDTFLVSKNSVKYKEDDEKKYRSFVSAPIVKYRNDGTSFCVGVVYGTSDKPHRFGEEAALPLRMISDYFASALPDQTALQKLRADAVATRKKRNSPRRSAAKRAPQAKTKRSPQQPPAKDDLTQ